MITRRATVGLIRASGCRVVRECQPVCAAAAACGPADVDFVLLRVKVVGGGPGFRWPAEQIVPAAARSPASVPDPPV